ncbi:hypothetical protein DLAC_10489 [Tieghemostelium lacteum]|uniref:Ubiquitin-like protease family profile domain-containing protein n=1 Tax=Tieghemostelium lacteum TaxID=361077 RepID=A0A151Z4M3_TIELA|nr:hypothetical protein DLAC_10489 [Tieghemostelium lacteum]|eukprot:KYQ88906.1 hypothetical protein DLAC_10489 [Tieghemostelium lacteum]
MVTNENLVDAIKSNAARDIEIIQDKYEKEKNLLTQSAKKTEQDLAKATKQMSKMNREKEKEESIRQLSEELVNEENQLKLANKNYRIYGSQLNEEDEETTNQYELWGDEVKIRKANIEKLKEQLANLYEDINYDISEDSIGVVDFDSIDDTGTLIPTTTTTTTSSSTGVIPKDDGSDESYGDIIEVDDSDETLVQETVSNNKSEDTTADQLIRELESFDKQITSNIKEEKPTKKKINNTNSKIKKDTDSKTKKGKDFSEQYRPKRDKSKTQGGGDNEPKGLYDHEIESLMKPYHKEGFESVIASDEIGTLDPKKKMSFIMNLDKSNQPGSHWVAVNIDTEGDKSIEYYDSFAKDPSDEFMEQIKGLVNKIKPGTYLKFKVNKVVDQRSNSTNCGYHAIKFLLNRYNGHPFKECTGWSEINKEEKEANQMRKKFKRFGYI